MKRLFVLLFATMLFLCACSPQDFTLDHKIIDVQYSSDMEYPEVLVFRNYRSFSTYAQSITESIDALPEDFYTDNENLVEPLKRYTRDYFRNNILIVVYISAGSGAYRYNVDEIEKSDEELTIKIIQDPIPDNVCVTFDMNAWCFLLELDESFDTPEEYIKVKVR